MPHDDNASPPDGLPAFTWPEQVVQALRPLGYEFVPAVPGQDLGKLTHAGVTIGAGLALTAGDLAKGVTRTEIRKALDEFWAKGKAFAKAHGGAFVPAPAFDPKTTKLGDELTIDRADEVSIRRAILT